MTLLSASPAVRQIEYPERDGNPISDHTLQFDWITLIKSNLDALYANNPDVFVAGDLLWYPVEGDNRTRVAPDVLVAFGCQKGPRGSFREWEEGVTPQVVFEILSPGNRYGEMVSKFLFYQRHGVEEYYLYDPFKCEFVAWIRETVSGDLVLQNTDDGFSSPRLGVRFVPDVDSPMVILGPDGKPFESFMEVEHRAEAAEKRADALAAKLRELGIDPDAG